MAKRKLNVAMIGYDFMGRAHANAWRQVARFFRDAPYEPVLKVVCGRTEAKVREAAVALARRLIEDGTLGDLHHYRGTYLQDWIVDPAFPRVWRLERSKAGS